MFRLWNFNTFQCIYRSINFIKIQLPGRKNIPFQWPQPEMWTYSGPVYRASWGTWAPGLRKSSEADLVEGSWIRNNNPIKKNVSLKELKNQFGHLLEISLFANSRGKVGTNQSSRTFPWQNSHFRKNKRKQILPGWRPHWQGVDMKVERSSQHQHCATVWMAKVINEPRYASWTLVNIQQNGIF